MKQRDPADLGGEPFRAKAIEGAPDFEMSGLHHALKSAIVL